MNNQQYLDRLNRLLKSLPAQCRADIIREIKSHINEPHNDDQTLEERFGLPEDLAQQYLDGEAIKPTFTAQLNRFGKQILIGCGGLMIAAIVAAALIMGYFSKDEFNYADETAAELTDKRRHWQSILWQDRTVFQIEQSKVIFYWHHNPTIRWHCEGDEAINIETGGMLKIRHNRCLIYLPQQASQIDAYQTDIVIVKPQASIRINIHQSNLRIAENGVRYQYMIDSTNSRIGALNSVEKADIQLAIVAVESHVSDY